MIYEDDRESYNYKSSVCGDCVFESMLGYISCFPCFCPMWFKEYMAVTCSRCPKFMQFYNKLQIEP